MKLIVYLFPFYLPSFYTTVSSAELRIPSQSVAPNHPRFIVRNFTARKYYDSNTLASFSIKRVHDFCLVRAPQESSS
jgi:hypothetical protein